MFMVSNTVVYDFQRQIAQKNKIFKKNRKKNLTCLYDFDVAF